MRGRSGAPTGEGRKEAAEEQLGRTGERTRGQGFRGYGQGQRGLEGNDAGFWFRTRNGPGVTTGQGP